MGLQFQSNVCRCLKTAAREVRNAEVTQEVRLRDGMPDIGRVLTSWGQVLLRSKEWQGNLVTVSGGIMVWILYAPEDGTPPRCMDTWVPFQLKWEVEETVGDGPICVYPLLRFVDSRSIAARKLMVRAGVAAFGEMLSTDQMQIYHPEELPEDIQILENTYPVRLTKEAGEKTFLLDEDLQLPTGAVQPERLLAYTVSPRIQEKRVAGDKILLRGIGKIHIIYRCEEGRIHTADLELPFSQFAQLDEMYGADAQANILLGITSLEVMENEGAQLRIKCGMVAQYQITDRQLVKVTEDAYSLRCKVDLNMEELKLPSILEQRTELIPLQQKIPGVDADVVDAVFLPDFPRQSRLGDQIALELCGQLQVLYYAQDGSLQESSARWQSGMHVAADAESKMCFIPQEYGVIQAVASSGELSLNGQLKLEMQTQNQMAIRVITGLEQGQPEQPDLERPSLILCRVGDQSIWNIAKQCGSTVKEIERINHLHGQPPAEQMLLIPVI